MMHGGVMKKASKEQRGGGVLPDHQKPCSTELPEKQCVHLSVYSAWGVICLSVYLAWGVIAYRKETTSQGPGSPLPLQISCLRFPLQSGHQFSNDVA